MQYEWDEAKAATNFAKHGITFTAAARALEDPHKIEILDDRFDYNEDRIQSLCMDRGKVLFVVAVMPKATRHEQERYFQGGPLLS